MGKWITIIVFAAAIALSAPVPASAGHKPGEMHDRAEEALREGAAKIMEALQLLLRSIPQYGAPEMLENGDIIIRRIHPPPPGKTAPPNGEPEDTRT